MTDLREKLQNLFGLDDFRPSQREVIEDVLSGKDVLCVMPTGAGKSLCFQLPACVHGGLSVVISPLISLMADQVTQMRDEGISAMLLNSALSQSEQRDALSQLAQGYEGLLYVAPERFNAPGFRNLLPTLNVKLLAIDEAHCISMWGHDFRPEYAQIGEMRELMKSPPTIALTATATEDVRNDIIHLLNLREPSVVVTGFDRSNLIYESVRMQGAEKSRYLVNLLKQEQGSGIIYCSTRKAVDELTSVLSAQVQGRSIFAYHAGMDMAARTANQDRFMQTAGTVAIATNAFGMGINKPDIRFVVHYNIPGTLEAYYQEAGRAGRDGLTSRCTILFSFQDRRTQEFFISKIGEGNDNADPALIADLKDRAMHKLDLMFRFAQTHRCRRQMILDYFGDEAEVVGCQCDVCRNGDPIHASILEVPEETVTLVRQILSAVARLKGKFGIGVLAEVLTGTRNEKTQRWGFDQLTVFGLLARFPVKRLIAMTHRLIEVGLIRQKEIESNIRTIELTPLGIAVMKGAQQPPGVLTDLAGAPAASGRRTRTARSTAEVDHPLDPEAQSRFDLLRQVRFELAKEKQLPPYVVCHDRTLKLIARLAPQKLAELEEIKGMGPIKVEMYGQRLLEAIQSPTST